MEKNNSFLKLTTESVGYIKKATDELVKGIGNILIRYIKEDNFCIVCVEPNGIIYGEGIYKYLVDNGKTGDITVIEKEGCLSNKEKLKGRKIIVVDAYLLSERFYRKIMAILDSEKKSLDIKGVKYVVFEDRIGMPEVLSLYNKRCPRCGKYLYYSETHKRVVDRLRERFCSKCLPTAVTIMKRMQKISSEEYSVLTLKEIAEKLSIGNSIFREEGAERWVKWLETAIKVKKDKYLFF